MKSIQIRLQAQLGFTLVEVMIVVAIIGVLASVALPQYSAFSKKSAEGACMAEAKAYAKSQVAILNDPAGAPTAPVVSACTSITTASTSAVPVTAVVKTPGTMGVSCVMTTGICAFTGT